MEGYHFGGIWRKVFDGEKYLAIVSLGGWGTCTHLVSFSFGGASPCIWGWRVFPTN